MCPPLAQHAPVYPGGADVAHFISTGPFNLSAGASDTIAFAIMGGRSLAELTAVKTAADDKYFCNILGKGPIKPFSISHPTAEPGFNVLFQDTNTGTKSWHWDFGDGNTSTVTGPVHSYAQAGVYTVRLTVSDERCTFSSSQQITITDQVSIDPEWGEIDVQFYPNPSRGKLSFKLNGKQRGNYSIILTSLSGQRVYSKEFRKNTQEVTERLEFLSVPAGMYLISLTGKEFRHYEKLTIE